MVSYCILSTDTIYIQVEKLRQLMSQHVVKPHWSKEMGVMTKESTDWETIADNLNCLHKWSNMQFGMLKKGPFTAEEDAVILTSVAEWGYKGNGLWADLMQEMGRPSESIRRRWRHRLGGPRVPLNPRNDN